MKTKHLVFGSVLLLALFLAACSQQAAPAEAMEEKVMASETTSESMDEKDDDMVVDEDGSAVSEDKGDAADADGVDHNGDDMGSVMKEEKDDSMMSDKDTEMDDHEDGDMIDAEDDTAMSVEKDEDMSDSLMMSDNDSQLPDWFKTSLIDVNSGNTFAAADLRGKVVLVETLAMWCSNCLKQQGQVQILHDLIGERDDFVSIGLDIDPNENADALKSYTSNNGFDWFYAVAPTEVSREIGQLYGDQFLNPPSTPMLIIDREGEVHLLPFGIKSAEDLLEALQPFLDVEM